MAYTDIISLAQARTYLRIDDTQNESDNEIIQMIGTALRFMEDHTNHIVDPRDIVYFLRKQCVRVYDFPINSIILPNPPDPIDQNDYELYSLFTTSDTLIETITLNVGYGDPTNIPPGIIDAALYIIKLLYYETESEKTLVDMLPMHIKLIINKNRRFII